MSRILIALIALLALPSSTFAQPVMKSIIEIDLPFPLPAGEMYDFVFVDPTAGVIQQSQGDPDGDGMLSITAPPQMGSVYPHTSSCANLCIENIGSSGYTTSGTVPFIVEDASGISLFPGFDVSDLNNMPTLALDDTFAVVNGEAVAFPAATIRAPGKPFDEITSAEWANPSVFPLYTGTARVSDLVDTTIINTCAADFDVNGSVDVHDLLDLLSKWGTPAGDIIIDGSTNIGDLLELLAAWGGCP